MDIEDGAREWVHLCNVLWVPSESEINARRLEIINGWSPALERQHRGVRVKEDDGLEIPRVSVPTESRGGIKHD